jgi:hypothetical protein
MIKKLLIVLHIFSFGGMSIIAQEIEFSATVDKDTIAIGETFQLSYELKNAQGKFEAPDLSQFQIYSGPNYSSSYAVINGESSMSMSYTFQLMSTDAGEYYIDPAIVKIGKEHYSTKPIKIVVIVDPNRPFHEDQKVQPSRTKRKKAIKI